MEAATQSAHSLKRQILEAEEQLANLREQLQKVELTITLKKPPFEGHSESSTHGNYEKDGKTYHGSETKWPLSSEEYKRYGRQMIVPSIGIQGQLRLRNASVLIIGAGGLGCPAAAYLVGAGIGTLGIVDGDVVETSNLHRQVLHSTPRVGMKKVDSAIEYLRSLNPNPNYVPYGEHISPTNAEAIVKDYDLVLDCTDHPTSRYLISDICVLLHKPLISASALRTDGQLIVLNSPALPPGNSHGGPCYRCVFPKPPPAESVVSCGDGGILGPVVGVMGVLQALEAVRMVTGGKLELSTTPVEGEPVPKNEASMLLFSANSSPPFRTLRLRSRRPQCFACSSSSDLTLQSLSSGSLDYVLFCGMTTPVRVLEPEERISALDYSVLLKSGKKHILVDVREKVQFDICSLDGSINIPFSTIQGSKPLDEQSEWLNGEMDIYVVCRLGNDSQIIARKLKDDGFAEGRYIGDIKGGLKAWKNEVDENWPEY